jgi:integrase
MTNTSIENETVKREFFAQLKGGRGFTESSVKAHADAIWKWQEFTQNDDFANFNKIKAAEFVGWLETRPSNTPSGKLSVSSRANYVRRVKKFFEWLAGQPGYKSRILKNDVEYLRLSKAEAQTVRYGTTRKAPTLDEAKQIIGKIEIKNEVDQRDRAMISLAVCTGMRIAAIVTLRMKSFDEGQKTFDQNPGDGVGTKNSKRILTTFLPIGWEDPARHFLDWYGDLKGKGFGPDDPIFPATQRGFDDQGLVGKEFWSGAGVARNIFKERCEAANVTYYNPHSFRHLVVSVMEKRALTEEQKKAISLSLGHEDVGTTFGAHGYGKMTNDDAIKTIRQMGATLGENKGKVILSEEEMTALKGLLTKIL